MKLLFKLTAVTSLLAIHPQCASARQVQGQVFIVTEAHESVKLALVSVSAYPLANIKNLINKVDSELKEERDKSEALNTSFTADKSKIEKTSEDLQKRSRANFADERLRTLAEEAWQLANVDLVRVGNLIQRRYNFLFGSDPYFAALKEDPSASTRRTRMGCLPFRCQTTKWSCAQNHQDVSATNLKFIGGSFRSHKHRAELIYLTIIWLRRAAQILFCMSEATMTILTVK